MLKAFLTHLSLVLTFRHDGSGLPEQYGPVAYVAAALAVMVEFARISVVDPERLVTAMGIIAIFWLIIRFVASAPVFVMAALAIMGVDLVFLALLLSPLTFDIEAVRMTLSVWTLGAMFTAIVRYNRRKTRERNDRGL